MWFYVFVVTILLFLRFNSTPANLSQTIHFSPIFDIISNTVHQLCNLQDARHQLPLFPLPRKKGEISGGSKYTQSVSLLTYLAYSYQYYIICKQYIHMSNCKKITCGQEFSCYKKKQPNCRHSTWNYPFQKKQSQEELFNSNLTLLF